MLSCLKSKQIYCSLDNKNKSFSSYFEIVQSFLFLLLVFFIIILEKVWKLASKGQKSVRPWFYTSIFIQKNGQNRMMRKKISLFSTYRILYRGLCFSHRQQASNIQNAFVYRSKSSFIQIIFCLRWRERVLINLSQDILLTCFSILSEATSLV